MQQIYSTIDLICWFLKTLDIDFNGNTTSFPLMSNSFQSFKASMVFVVSMLINSVHVLLFTLGCNMLLVNNKRVKISNLSVSVKLDENEDYSEVKRCLPAVILPPEVIVCSVHPGFVCVVYV